MPQIPHPQQPRDLCSQTYPQKMGIDNSRAAQSEFRLILGIFFLLVDQKGSENVGGATETMRAFNRKRVGGGRTYRE
jgi:hypothetical protein